MRRRSRPTSKSFAVLEPDADGFRNYLGNGHDVPAEHLLIERAFRLTLSAPEMTVLVGGLRALNVTAGQSGHGVFTTRPGTLTNDYFVNLLDMGTEWKPTSDAADAFEGRCRTKGDRKWTASRVDLVFGSNSELRALAEVYACDDAREKFVARLRGGVEQGDEPRSLRRPVLGQNTQRPVEPRLVAESVEPERAPHEPPGGRSHGRGVQLRRRVQDARPRCREEGHRDR